MKATVFVMSLLFSAMALADNLIENFDMAQTGEHGFPAEWRISHPVHLERNDTQVSREEITEAGNTFPILRIIKTTQNDNVGLGSQEIEIPEGTGGLYIQSRMRARSVKHGEKFWHAPGVGVSYLFADGRAQSGNIDQWLKVPEGDSGWKIYEVTIPVRDNAPKASIAVVAHGWSGILDIDWILVRAVPAD